MGIVKSSGSINIKNEYVPPSEMEEVVSAEEAVVHPTPQMRADSAQYIKNTVESGNAVPDGSHLIQAMSEFVSGIPVTVTFYHVINNDTFGRSFSTDFDRELDPVHTSYLKINNFQMRLKDSMQFNYETESTISQQVGEAVLYPYFCPNAGDLFLYELPSKRTGLFKITEAPTRLAIHDTTCHEIKFRLMEFLTPALLAKIEASVSEVAHFNLKRYLVDSGALLTSNETDILNKANRSFRSLVHAYSEEFYNTDTYNTFVENVGLYDPYIVEFIARVVETPMLPGYPTQLMPSPSNWKRSFWYKMLDPGMVPDNILVDKSSRILYSVNYRTARVNALANRQYIELSPKGKHCYPPFKVPCEYDDKVISVPMQVALYFNEGKVRPAALLKLAQDVLSMRRIARFYYAPVILFLLKKLIMALSSGKEELILNTPVTDKCVQDCQNCVYECDRNGDVVVCTLPDDADEGIVPHIPACGGSTTDDDSSTAHPPPLQFNGVDYSSGICNKVWRQQHHGGPPSGQVHMYPTDVFYTKEQVDQMIRGVNTEIQTPDISVLPDSTNILSGIRNTIAGLSDGLGNKVDKVPGKSLSTHDFDDDYKDMLDNLEGAVNIPDASEDVKGIIQLASEDEVVEGVDITKAVVPSTLKTVLEDKVDVIEGMGLSSNDYTNADKQKVANALTSVADAAIDTKGIIQLAIDDEAEAGEDQVKAITPKVLKTELDRRISAIPKPDMESKEDVINKVGDFDVIDDIKYPTTKAVSEYVTEELLDKVDVVDGMGLSTNDFTNDLKSKLENLEDSLPDATTEEAGIIRIATEEEVEDGESDDGAVVPSTLKTMLDTKADVNEIPNISGKEDSSNKAADFNIVDDVKYPSVKAVSEYITENLNAKVDKIDNMGLSSNDFTNEYKQAIDDNTTALGSISTALDAILLIQNVIIGV